MPNYARKLVTARSGGFHFVLDPVAEFSPLDNLGQAVLTVGFAPFLLGPEHQLVRHAFRQVNGTFTQRGQRRLSTDAPLGLGGSVPDLGSVAQIA